MNIALSLLLCAMAAQDCPTLPPRHEVVRARREYMGYINTLVYGAEYRQAYFEYQVWDKIDDVQLDSQPRKACALKWLRELLGDDYWRMKNWRVRKLGHRPVTVWWCDKEL